MLATKRALEELLSLLRCAQCEGPLQEPHVVGLCGHTVCRRCIGGRDACGVCGSPTTQRELGPDPQMSGVLACATKLEQLLASVTSPSSDGLETNDGDPPASSTSCAKNVQGPASRQCLLAHAGEVCLSRALPSSTRKVAERRNRLGETPLQVAAIKGDAARVKALLSAGANPNVRDNAGWTPLQGSLAPLEVQTFGGERKKVLSMERSGMMKCKHEASSQGALEVVRLLIAAGACVNTAGPDGITPLHDAVLSNVPDVVLLLRSAGANADASANDGRTPGSLAQNELMRAALRSPAAPAAAAAVQPSVVPPAERGSCSGGAGLVLLLASGLDEAQCQALAQCARLLGGSCATSFSRQGALYGSSWNKGVRPARAACNSEAVSHLVVTCDKQGNCCQRTLKVLSAMVAGTWIVNFSWVEECLQRGVRVDEATHEAQGVRQHPNTGAPQRARLSGGGTLFSCYSVVLQGTFARGPSRDDLATLLTMGGAQLLARVPPSSKDQQTVLVVTDQPHTSTTARSSTAVLVEPSWVLDCISRFELAPLPVA